MPGAVASFLGRAALGGLAGGLTTGDWAGAAGGATIGGFGFGALSKIGNRANIARLAAPLLRGGRKAGLHGWWAASKISDPKMRAAAIRGVRGWDNVMKSGLEMKVRNVNKWGGYALGAAGIASGAHIGSSILASNRMPTSWGYY